MTLPFYRSSDSPPQRASLSPEASEAELCRSLAAGEAQALEALFHRYHAPACAFANRCLGSDDIGEDLVQEVFLYTWRHRSTVAIHASFKAYLYSAIRNAAISHLRHHRVVKRGVGEVIALFDRAPVTPDQDLTASEANAQLQAAIRKLPPRCRAVFALQREQGLTYAEIAAALGISVKTVDAQMGRALKSLRGTLGPSWP